MIPISSDIPCINPIPVGLSLQYNVITPEKEKEIITWLDSRQWSNEISRRTQHFGFEYNYRSKDIIPGTPLQGPILEIANLLENAGLMKPVQCIVNEYYRNQGVAPHIDNLLFGPVISGLSIGDDGVMSFSRVNSMMQIERFECFLPRRSVVMLSGPARYDWKHSIQSKLTYIDSNGMTISKSQDYRRISLTYRELTS